MPNKDGTGPNKRAIGPKDGRGFKLKQFISKVGLGKKLGGKKGNCKK